MKVHQFFVLLLVVLCSFVRAETGEDTDQRIDTAHQVIDPAYGQILYHYYQRQYFAAMSHIVVALEQNALPQQANRARVLLGSLYASYGMPDEARALFDELLEESVSEDLAARVWLHLAEIEYRKGRYVQAMALMDEHLSEVPETVSENYQALRTRLLMKLGRYDETEVLLDALPESGALSGYLRYNLAVSRINAGQGEAGTELLWQLVNLPPGNDEINALKDKSMLALGVHYLRTEQIEQARTLMQSARIEGPYSEMALLLHARAWLASDQPQEALSSLQLLTARPLQLQETQEGLLAVPFLYDRLGDYARARQAYLTAIEKFTGHFNYLSELEQGIRAGNWFVQLVQEEEWSTAMDPLPEFLPARVDSFATFRNLFASDHFQRYWRAWQEQNRQINLLLSWKQRLPALNQLLEAHVRRHRETLPLARQLLQEVESYQAAERLAQLQNRFATAKAGNDMSEFASEQELVWLDAMDVAQEKAQAWSDRLAPEVADKVDFYQRVLAWELRKDEVPRFWRRESELAELDQLRTTHEGLVGRVEHAASGLSQDVYSKGQLLAELNGGLYQMTARGQSLLLAIQRELEAQARREIDLTRERLRFYIAECWAAVGELEHRAINSRRMVPQSN